MREHTLHEFAVSTRAGQGAVVALGVVAILLLVAFGVTHVSGGPPGVEAWKWPMAIIGGAALAGAFAAHHQRRRSLRIVRSAPGTYALVVDGEGVRLAFPLAVSGDQSRDQVGSLPQYGVTLKLLDDRGRGVFLTQTRGAAYGPQKNWLTHLDRGGTCAWFEARGLDQLAELREAVEQLQRRR
jgi:hypothetical protein